VRSERGRRQLVIVAAAHVRCVAVSLSSDRLASAGCKHALLGWCEVLGLGRQQLATLHWA
jgi:hypothetical protein